MWCLVRDDVSTIVRRGIQTQKFMFTIMWNPRRFHVVNQLLSDTKMDSNYFTTNILAPLREEFIPRDRVQRPKPLVVHVECRAIHTSGVTQRFMSEHQMSRMPKPPYSPDLAPSDFSLFSTVKNRLERIHTVDGDDLFGQLSETLQAIPVHRVREVSEGNGDYIA
jgi:hypothetical protein